MILADDALRRPRFISEDNLGMTQQFKPPPSRLLHLYEAV